MSAKSNKKRSISKPKFLSSKKSKTKKDAPEEDAEGAAPRITSDTVAEHREEILSGARRFIYPLQHSRKRVVVISIAIITAIIIGSISFSALLLYRYQSTGNFAYQVSQVIPFPVAKVNGTYVPFEHYLFEMNYSLYYYRTISQEGVDIESSEGQQVLRQLKQDALEKVKLDEMARQLAKDNDINVTNEDINRQIELIRNNSGVGDSDEAFEDIIRSSYDWDINDLRRSLRTQLIRQSLPRVLDTETIGHAQEASQKITEGEKFEDLVATYSDDILTKDRKGVIGEISRTDTQLPPEFIEAAFSLGEGEVSGVVESRFGLHIIKINKIDGDTREVAHILFQYFDVEEFLREEISKVEVSDYITVE